MSIKNVYDVADQLTHKSSGDLKEIVIYHPEDNFTVYPFLLSSALGRFLASDSIDRFYVLPHIKQSLISTYDSDHPSLQDAQQLLLATSHDPDYNEAYAVDKTSFDEMIRALFWLTRYDASLPELIILYPERADYFVNVCKYGNLHFHVREDNASAILKQLQDYGLEEWHGQEFERFGSSDVIEGRFTKP